MLFLHSFSSMLIVGAGRDAKQVAKQIAARSKELAKRVAVTRVPAIAEEQALS
jgi:hypothetical protein